MKIPYGEYSALLTEPLLLLISFTTALFLSPLVRASYSNQYRISSALNNIKFNPETNFYRLLFIIIASLLIFLFLKRLYFHKYYWPIKALVIILIMMSFILHAQPNELAGFAQSPGTLDNFHTGEEISPANALLNGASLYDRIFFLRGAGVDAVFPAVGMKIFGHSIGGFMLADIVLLSLALIAFLLLLAREIKNPVAYFLLAVAFYCSSATSLTEERDIFVWAVFWLLALFFGKKRASNKLILTGIGLISSLTLFISIDRGILLLGFSILLAVTLLFLEPSNDNSYHFKFSFSNALKTSGYVLLGVLVGFVMPALFMGARSFGSFLKMTFIEIPKFGGLLVSQQFPPLFGDTYAIWAPVIISIPVAYLLIGLFRQRSELDLNKLIPCALLLIFGILSIKIGSNRINVGKMATATAPLYLASIMIISLAIRTAYKSRKDRAALMVPIIISILAITCFAQININKLAQTPIVSHTELAAYLHLSSTQDSHWVTPETLKVSEYIKQNTDSKDYIFALTSDPIYYYLSNRNNPTRFYVSWFADPQPYTDEVLKDLKANKPKLIIFSEKTWLDAPDNYSMEERAPEVANWLIQNYPQHVNIGNTTLLLPY